VNVTLSANRTYIADGVVVNEQVVVAHLRGNVQAALSLRKAIDDALLLAVPQVRARQADACPPPGRPKATEWG
jgi:hypothetical protein